MNYDLPTPFRMAKLASTDSNFTHKKMGAVILNSIGKPVSTGWNIYGKTHPKYADGIKVYSIHCEIHAIIRAESKIENGSIYVYRQIYGDHPAMAKPCNDCMKWLIESEIYKIYYTIFKWPYYEVIEL